MTSPNSTQRLCGTGVYWRPAIIRSFMLGLLYLLSGNSKSNYMNILPKYNKTQLKKLLRFSRGKIDVLEVPLKQCFNLLILATELTNNS